MPVPYTDVRASLPLQVALYFNGYYSAAFFVVTLLLFIYKGIMLPYPTAAIGLEVAFVFAWAIVEAARIYLGSRGNKTELIAPLLVSIALAVPVIIFHAYYIVLQTYVMRLDQIINGIALAFDGFEVLLSLFAALSFVRARRF